MPLSLLFAFIATIYFSMNFDFNKALRLGILAGVLASLASSLVMAFIIQIVRVIRRHRFKKNIRSSKYQKREMPIRQDPTIYEKTTQSKQSKATSMPSGTDSVIETFMLLMDRELAYEVALTSIKDQNIAEIIEENAKEKSIYLHAGKEEIHIKISSLTKHTAQVLISSTHNKDTIRKIIAILKAKEHSFMQY